MAQRTRRPRRATATAAGRRCSGRTSRARASPTAGAEPWLPLGDAAAHNVADQRDGPRLDAAPRARPDRAAPRHGRPARRAPTRRCRRPTARGRTGAATATPWRSTCRRGGGDGRRARRASSRSPPTARATARRSAGRCGSAPWQGVGRAAAASVRLDALLSAGRLAVRVDAAGRRGRPGPLPRALRPRLADRALQVLPARPEVAAATLRALAALQGQRDDPEVDEQPGKILHEYRPPAPGVARQHDWPVRDGELRYYGSADSTPWFLVVLAALGDDALSGRARARVAGGRRLARAGARRRRRARPLRRRASTRAGSPSRAGATSSTRRARTATAAGSCAPTARCRAAPLADADMQAVAYAALRALAALSRRGRAGSGARRRWPRGSRRDFGPEVMALEGDGLAGPGPGLAARLAAVERRAARAARATRSPRACASPTC